MELNKIVFRFVSIVIIVLLNGCGAKSVAMKPGTIEKLQSSETLIVIRSASPEFTIVTAGRLTTSATFQLLSHIISGIQSEEKGHDSKLDPSITIQKTLSGAMQEKYNAGGVNIIEAPQGLEEIRDLKETSGDNLILHIETTSWGLIHYPLDWDRFRLEYIAEASLINPQGPDILWQGNCTILEYNPEIAPTPGELAVNNGALLKNKLVIAADECLKQFTEQLDNK